MVSTSEKDRPRALLLGGGLLARKQSSSACLLLWFLLCDMDNFHDGVEQSSIDPFSKTVPDQIRHSKNKHLPTKHLLASLLGTSASLLVTSALLVVTRFATRNKCLTSSNKLGIKLEQTFWPQMI